MSLESMLKLFSGFLFFEFLVWLEERLVLSITAILLHGWLFKTIDFYKLIPFNLRNP
jgi:hypothetical protein